MRVLRRSKTSAVAAICVAIALVLLLVLVLVIGVAASLVVVLIGGSGSSKQQFRRDHLPPGVAGRPAPTFRLRDARGGMGGGPGTPQRAVRVSSTPLILGFSVLMMCA